MTSIDPIAVVLFGAAITLWAVVLVNSAITYYRSIRAVKGSDLVPEPRQVCVPIGPGMLHQIVVVTDVGEHHVRYTTSDGRQFTRCRNGFVKSYRLLKRERDKA